MRFCQQNARSAIRNKLAETISLLESLRLAVPAFYTGIISPDMAFLPTRTLLQKLEELKQRVPVR